MRTTRLCPTGEPRNKGDTWVPCHPLLVLGNHCTYREGGECHKMRSEESMEALADRRLPRQTRSAYA